MPYVNAFRELDGLSWNTGGTYVLPTLETYCLDEIDPATAEGVGCPCLGTFGDLCVNGLAVSGYGTTNADGPGFPVFDTSPGSGSNPAYWARYNIGQAKAESPVRFRPVAKTPAGRETVLFASGANCFLSNVPAGVNTTPYNLKTTGFGTGFDTSSAQLHPLDTVDWNDPFQTDYWVAESGQADPVGVVRGRLLAGRCGVYASAVVSPVTLTELGTVALSFTIDVHFAYDLPGVGTKRFKYPFAFTGTHPRQTALTRTAFSWLPGLRDTALWPSAVASLGGVAAAEAFVKDNLTVKMAAVLKSPTVPLAVYSLAISVLRPAGERDYIHNAKYNNPLFRAPDL